MVNPRDLAGNAEEEEEEEDEEVIDMTQTANPTGKAKIKPFVALEVDAPQLGQRGGCACGSTASMILRSGHRLESGRGGIALWSSHAGEHPPTPPPPKKKKTRLIGQVVKASVPKAEGPEFEYRLRRNFSESSHTSDLKFGTPVATLPGAWHDRVSAGTGRPGVSTVWPGETASLICNFYLSVAARTIVWVDPSLRHTSIWLGR